MKRLEYLLNDVRLATDNLDTNGIKDRELIQYFNDAIKAVQLIIFKNAPKCDFFIEETAEILDCARDVAIPLPSDCYAQNAITCVMVKSGSCFYAIDRVNPEDDRNGFLVRGKNIYLNFDGAEAVKIQYFKRLPRFDKRWAKVDSVTSSVIQLLEATDSDLPLIDDTISIVNSEGVIIQENVKVAIYNLPNTISSLTTIDGSVAPGDFIVSGGYSTTLCDLPDECETYLTDYVKQRIFTRNNYSDAQKQALFSVAQQEALVDLFSNSSKDITSPPITDTDYLWI